MGSALFITLERKIKGLDTFVNGKVLSAASDRLDKVAKNLKVKLLMDFYSANPEEVEDFAGFEVPDLLAETFFPAAEGLKTVKALREHLEENPKAVARVKDVIADLEDFERILAKASDQGVKWHLSVDY